jgi:ATP-dependent exoDNAse (exonuclease V) alpha subunit
LKQLTCEQPILEDSQWMIRKENTTGPDTFAEEIYEHVLDGRSCMINGPPGSGKSFIIKAMAIRLRLAGHDVQVLAPTNSAARILDGQTCHCFINRVANSRKPFQGIILIDEVSMLSLSLVSVLDQLRAGDCQIISVGDWDQLPPVSNSWRGKEVDQLILKDSKVLKRWAGTNMFILTRCRRSDQAHFDFYTSLPDDLQSAKNLTIQRYKKRSKIDLHLVISHKHRKMLNKTEQDAFSQGKVSVLIPEHDELAYKCVTGTPIIGTCTNKKIINGAFYELINVNPLQIKDTLTNEIIDCTPDLLSKNTTLAWSVVYNRAQGLTIKNKVICLHDMHSKHFKRNHLYVGLSRVTNGSDIRVR